jgi:SNF2 family DNA or RNA helicase
MIKPIRIRRDWFELDGMTAGPIRGLPGAKLTGLVTTQEEEIWHAHRSHLPLIESTEALALIAPRATDQLGFIWEARNTHTARLGFTLRNTQHTALDFIGDRNGTLLADDMRLGKTLTAIMSHDASLGPLFIVAPLSTRAVWLAWIKRVFPGTSIGIMTGKTFQPEQLKQPIVFGHYEIIHKWQALIDIGTLVFDEAHMLTNRNARRTLAAQLLRARAKRVLCMTGTPIWNMPPNLWAVLSLVAPGAWGSWYDFSDRYGLPEPTAHGKKYTGASNVPELNARLTDVMLRRLWKDCASDLPPITRSVLIAEVSDAQRKRLDIITARLKSERSNTAGNLATYRKHVSTVKVPIVVEEVQKVLAANEPVVAWTWHREMADTLQRRFLDLGVPVFMISGDIPVARRDALIDAWKAHPAAVLVATMSVAQVGIDLSHARVAIFGEIDYTPAIIAQTEMRTFMATRPMDIRFVIANHLTDQRIVRALIAKLGAADPLGVGAAVDTIDALRDAVMGPRDDGDLDRLMEDLLASAT